MRAWGLKFKNQTIYCNGWVNLQGEIQLQAASQKLQAKSCKPKAESQKLTLKSKALVPALKGPRLPVNNRIEKINGST
jgi:hypothetical protein